MFELYSEKKHELRETWSRSNEKCLIPSPKTVKIFQSASLKGHGISFLKSETNFLIDYLPITQTIEIIQC